MFSFRKRLSPPTAAEALPGRPDPILTAGMHIMTGHNLKPPFPDGIETALFAMGCFWGAERKYWELGGGIYVTAAGYAGGFTLNPNYEEVCSGATGHAEAVLVAFDPAKISYIALLKTFWENHDPTQGMRQGNDAGSQYRSGIYVADAAQRAGAEASKDTFAKALSARGLCAITTEICDQPEFYYAEAYHQQYLAKNPQGYCGLGGTGVACPIGIAMQQN
ncbi:MAG: peptide-methionine (S)-S-oxide reductase MsrA [Beijerinckiaceae bacterium]|nr:peptide-methionine (S)-S-oxide reductase MsrA [Beijerinckiaceae bacterium]MCI0737092.1 peptide-methionine (S)-S-oxide reductase MsrA [Beijerinckiaceae bacterium]